VASAEEEEEEEDNSSSKMGTTTNSSSSKNNTQASGATLLVEPATDNKDTTAPGTSAGKVSETAKLGKGTCKDNDDDPDRTSKDYYFDSYAHHAIHEEMLKDEVRTRTYEMAIMQNKHLFQEKIVLDVGCGTGILSMFAAQAGAKQVYAIDCSTIIEQAREIVKINGLAEKITLIQGKVEEIELPDGLTHVDIIISEWMGYFLLYESMLNTVLYARDKWLVPNGIIFPDKAVMYLTGVEDGNVKRDRFDFWDDVYGFDMTPIKQIAISEPVVDVVDAKSLVTDSVPILHLDILTCTEADLEFASNFKLTAQKNDYVHGLVAYFECAFTQIHKPIGFSTAPFARYTHWKQTILYLEEPLTIFAGETVFGEISCKPNKQNNRDLDIGLTINCKGRYSEVKDKKARFRLR